MNVQQPRGPGDRRIDLGESVGKGAVDRAVRRVGRIRFVRIVPESRSVERVMPDGRPASPRNALNPGGDKAQSASARSNRRRARRTACAMVSSCDGARASICESCRTRSSTCTSSPATQRAAAASKTGRAPESPRRRRDARHAHRAGRARLRRQSGPSAAPGQADQESHISFRKQRVGGEPEGNTRFRSSTVVRRFSTPIVLRSHLFPTRRPQRRLRAGGVDLKTGLRPNDFAELTAVNSGWAPRGSLISGLPGLPGCPKGCQHRGSVPGRSNRPRQCSAVRMRR